MTTVILSPRGGLALAAGAGWSGPCRWRPDPAAVADQSGALQEALREWLAALAEGQSPASAPRELDEEQQKKLRALGYVR